MTYGLPLSPQIRTIEFSIPIKRDPNLRGAGGALLIQSKCHWASASNRLNFDGYLLGRFVRNEMN